jgi:hypothetical protein
VHRYRFNPFSVGAFKALVTLCCGRISSAWGFKFLPYDAKFDSEGHYFPNFEGILMKL